MNEESPLVAKEERRRPAARRVATYVALNMIPFYPLYNAIRSVKTATKPGAMVIADLSKQLPHKRTNRIRRTWREALEARSPEALPLPVIKRKNLQAKRIFMIGWFFAVCSAFGCSINANWMGIANSALFMLVCTMQIFKHELRLRQMELGPLAPDEPLLSPREFFRARGFIHHFANIRIDWK